MIIAALFSSLVIGVGSFAWGYAQIGLIVVSRWMIAFGIFWLISIWQKWRWVSTLGVLLAIPFAIFGLWFNFIIGWMFSGMIFVLFAWNLTEFQRKLKFALPRDDIKAMIRRHLARISLLALAGLLLASLLMALRGQIPSEWGPFMLGVFLLSLFQLIGWFRR